MDDNETDMSATLITLTAEIVAAHVSNNSVPVGQVSELISGVHAALSGLGDGGAQEEARPEPAVSIRTSVKKDRIACLDCGQKFKVLKRHLTAEHGFTPDEYRERWGLSSDYPMVAPAYAEMRSDLAKKLGLGRKPGQKRGRQKKA